MIIEAKLKLAKQYYLENKERYEEFAKKVFNDHGSGHSSIGHELDFSTEQPYSGYYKFPNITNINILHIICRFFDHNPKLSQYYIDNLVKSSILSTVIHERLHCLQFRPTRFHGIRDISKNQKAYNYYEDPVHSCTCECILCHLDYFSDKYDIDKEILQIYTIGANAKSYIKNKKFRKSSQYNDLKYVLHGYSDFKFDKEFESKAMGKNYYTTTIAINTNSDNNYIIIKRGSHWVFNSLVELCKRLRSNSYEFIQVGVFEDFNIDDLREYIQNNYPGYENRICNALGRYISSNFKYGITKEEMKNYIYEDNTYIRGFGEKSKEIIRGYFYTEE